MKLGKTVKFHLYYLTYDLVKLLPLINKQR